MAECAEKVYFCRKNKTMNPKGNPNIADAGKDTQFRAGYSQVIVARKGANASNEVQRQKKLLRESIMEAADMVAVMSDEEKKEIIARGVDPNDVTNRMRFVAALWTMAGKASKDGAQDRRLLMDASGEMTQKIDIGGETVEDFMEKVFGHD